jgi:hypothetical protein
MVHPDYIAKTPITPGWMSNTKLIRWQYRLMLQKDRGEA